MPDDKGKVDEKVDAKGDAGDKKADVKADKADKKVDVKDDKVDVKDDKRWKDAQEMIGKQSTEVGTLRQELASTQKLVEDLNSKLTKTSKATEKTEKSDDMEKLFGELGDVDFIEDSPKDVAKKLRVLIETNTERTRQETLEAATSAFKEELDARDVTNTHNAFYKENPDFDTPEMQSQIEKQIANDTTGMSDPLVAFREIQRDAAEGKARQLEEENAELKRLVELAGGADETGKVITQGQAALPAEKQPKTKGKDRDLGMQAALDAIRET